MDVTPSFLKISPQKVKHKILRPVHPNVGIEVEYRYRLDRLIEGMQRSLARWIFAQWRRNPPRTGELLAEDESPVTELRREMGRLSRRWKSKFDEMAPELAKYFATAAAERAQGTLKRALADGGMTVEFKTTPAMRDAMSAAIGENVGLIKSIASECLTDVEGHVLRSVQHGRSLGELAKTLEKQFSSTRKRAALIARDQNNKMTAVITRVRQMESGISRAVWFHSGAGKHPRPAHVAMSGKFYDVAKGMWDSHEGAWVIPGQLINCRCVSRPVVEL